MDTLTERTLKRFEKAITSLERALALDELPDHAERDAALLRFELTAELMPKVLQRLLSERGADVALPKDTVRAMVAANLIGNDDASTLLSVIDDRNRMVHDYSEEFSLQLLARIRDPYAPVLRKLLQQLTS